MTKYDAANELAQIENELKKVEGQQQTRHYQGNTYSHHPSLRQIKTLTDCNTRLVNLLWAFFQGEIDG